MSPLASWLVMGGVALVAAGITLAILVLDAWFR